jgi:BNR repeat-containing family member
MHARTARAAGALLTFVLLLLPGCAAGAAVPAVHAVAPCSWSYFGDARSVAHEGHVYTACVGTDGSSLIEDFELATGRRRLRTVFEPLEVDDHNNPSLVVFRGELYAFSSPHSGYLYPRDRRSQMRYRVLRDGRWGPLRSVPLGSGCGLGYTYPNPVVGGDRLYLFMRGPCWAPYFTSTADGERWAAPRTLVRSPSPSRQDGRGTRKVRPYAKYASAPDGSVLMTFSDGHPGSFKSSLYFARLVGGRIHAADGRLIGTLADLPLRFHELDRVHAYSPAAGRAWPMDVALDRSGAPVAIYTALSGVHDTFRYARWDGRLWRTHPIAAAGRTLFSYHNSGATLDHADPSRVVLSRTIGGQNEIELRETADGGASWTLRPVTSRSHVFNIRPVIPRGLDDRGRLLVVYVAGSARSFREYDTTVVMRSVPLEDEKRSGMDPGAATASAIQRTWACSPPESCSQGAGSKRPWAAAAWASSIALVNLLWTATWRSRSSRPSTSRTRTRATAS